MPNSYYSQLNTTDILLHYELINQSLAQPNSPTRLWDRKYTVKNSLICEIDWCCSKTWSWHSFTRLVFLWQVPESWQVSEFPAFQHFRDMCHTMLKCNYRVDISINFEQGSYEIWTKLLQEGSKINTMIFLSCLCVTFSECWQAIQNKNGNTSIEQEAKERPNNLS